MSTPPKTPDDPRVALDRAAKALAPTYDEALRERVPPSLERMVARLDGRDELPAPDRPAPEPRAPTRRLRKLLSRLLGRG